MKLINAHSGAPIFSGENICSCCGGTAEMEISDVPTSLVSYWTDDDYRRVYAPYKGIQVSPKLSDGWVPHEFEDLQEVHLSSEKGEGSLYVRSYLEYTRTLGTTQEIVDSLFSAKKMLGDNFGPVLGFATFNQLVEYTKEELENEHNIFGENQLQYMNRAKPFFDSLRGKGTDYLFFIIAAHQQEKFIKLKEKYNLDTSLVASQENVYNVGYSKADNKPPRLNWYLYDMRSM